ncbi:hypothetical protein NESM_000394000 [Novymonas esmeraldas]|uniref:EF-hand domain-containing protein n=1 Tax=Novymonas esmeraldas TaxID=1808958 RepID=A0AAW0EKU5_9TRYP
MPNSPKARGSTKGSKGRRGTTNAASLARSRARASAAEAALPESIAHLGGKQRTANRRAHCHKRFEDLAQLIVDMNPTAPPNTGAKGGPRKSKAAAATTSSSLPSASTFPTLQVGYLARALGLNVSSEQVASIVELVEADGPSSGSVDRRLLGYVLVDAMMTGTLGGPTLYEFTVAAPDGSTPACLSVERLTTFKPSLCVRAEETELFRAFEALDTTNRGYLEEVQLRSAMMEGKESLSAEEAEEMWLAMRDPETNRAHYRDFAEILARD